MSDKNWIINNVLNETFYKGEGWTAYPTEALKFESLEEALVFIDNIKKISPNIQLIVRSVNKKNENN